MPATQLSDEFTKEETNDTEVDILRKDGRASDAEELGVGEELFDCLVILAELRTVALVENKNHSHDVKRNPRLSAFAVEVPRLTDWNGQSFYEVPN